MKHLSIAFFSTGILALVVTFANWAGVLINRCEEAPAAETVLGFILILGSFAFVSYASEEIAS